MKELKRTLHIMLLSISLSVVYELKIGYSWNSNYRIVVFIILSYILSNIVSKYLAEIFAKIKIIRMMVLNKCWLEGFWLIETYLPDTKIAVSRGIMHITQDDISPELSITGYKSKNIDSEIETMSNSIYATINQYDLSYLCYWKYIVESDFIHGVSIGNFYVDIPKIYPTRYDGSLFYFSKYPKMRQVAHKIEKSEISHYIKNYNTNWKKHYLMEKEGELAG